MVETKKVKMFPYSIKLPQNYLTAGSWKSKYSRDADSLRANMQPYGEHRLLLLFEGANGDFIDGRFLKLRSDAPKILKEQTAEELEIQLHEGDWIEEVSHFILHTKDGRILAEYNQASVRHFPTPLDFYLRSTLGLSGEDVDIRPIKIEGALAELKKENKLYSVNIKVAKPNLSFLEKKLKMNTIQVLKAWRESDFDIQLSVIHKPRKQLDRDETMKFVEDIYSDKNELEMLRVETKDAAYDLINGTLLHFRDDIVLDSTGRFILSRDFYEKARRIYNRNRSAIRQVLSDGEE